MLISVYVSSSSSFCVCLRSFFVMMSTSHGPLFGVVHTLFPGTSTRSADVYTFPNDVVAKP